ncbi:hypothetical protein C4D60_Mb03t21940 [Musa balbisiana]|uniref:Uncharacterized protein n=1 Tax=Musa balbisiana TaxID=52838 RepID=A0A4S8JBM4_MUSBA|nr:hypothetical protein C4D60_Mb03t21940 [Musa balbisiana]
MSSGMEGRRFEGEVVAEEEEREGGRVGIIHRICRLGLSLGGEWWYVGLLNFTVGERGAPSVGNSRASCTLEMFILCRMRGSQRTLVLVVVEMLTPIEMVASLVGLARQERSTSLHYAHSHLYLLGKV